MPDPDVKILETFESQKPNDAGRYVYVMETKFRVGGDGPFSVWQPEATFDPALQQQLIDAKAALVRAARDGYRG